MKVQLDGREYELTERAGERGPQLIVTSGIYDNRPLTGFVERLMLAVLRQAEDLAGRSKTQRSFDAATAEVREFNRYPVGTRVKFWPSAREGEGRTGTTSSTAWVTDAGKAVVLIAGQVGWTALSHVEVVQ